MVKTRGVKVTTWHGDVGETSRAMLANLRRGCYARTLGVWIGAISLLTRGDRLVLVTIAKATVYSKLEVVWYSGGVHAGSKKFLEN